MTTREPRVVAVSWSVLERDRIAQLGAAVYGVVAVAYFAGWISAGNGLSDLIFFPVLFLAARSGVGRLSRRQERRFFDDLALAFLAWLAATAVTLFAPAAWDATRLVSEAFNAGYYVALVRALERYPHRRSSRSTGLDRALAWPAAAAFCCGLFVYFALIPLVFNRPFYDASASFLYLVLDGYVGVRLLLFARSARSAAWRASYLLMALASASFFYNSLINSFYYSSHAASKTWDVPAALLWNATFLAFVLACRVRLTAGAVTRRAASPRRRLAVAAREQTLVFVLLFPALHFAGYAFGVLDAPSKGAREVTMVLWLLLIGSIALAQRRLLVRSHLDLDRDTAAMSEELEGRRLLEDERERFIQTLEAKNAEVRASNAEMERFSYAISHDLRNPLITIMAFSGRLLSDAENGKPGDGRSIDRIEAASEKLAQLLNDLLELSKAGRRLEAPADVDLGELARQAVDLVAVRVAERSAEVVVAPDLPVVRGDRNRLLELLQNLLDNAVKFTAEGRRPRVEIGLTHGEEGPVVSVRDHGIGIDPRYHDKVFGVFDQLDPAVEGAGLGLALARRIVEVHGGRIWIASSDEGAGTTVCFTLPPGGFSDGKRPDSPARPAPLPARVEPSAVRDDAATWLREPHDRTLLISLALPLVYFSMGSVGLLAEAARPALDVAMLVWVASMGAVALTRHRSLERSHRRLEESKAALSSEIDWRQRLDHERRRFISQLETANADLEAKHAELERFAYTISHDLKSPLITVRGFLRLLRQDVVAGDAERVKHSAERIRSASHGMLELLDDLLELSRAGRIVAVNREVEMAEVAREAVSRVAGVADEHGVEIEVRGLMPAVAGDFPRLVEVFQNLIENAVKYMGAQARPRVEAGARENAGETVFYVRDNGGGIEPEDQEKIFRLFQRLDPSVEGTGVGLALVKRIVEAHGGRVWVESEGRQRGSTFCFTLPRPAPVPSGRDTSTEEETRR